MLGVGGEPGEVVVGVPEALELGGAVLGFGSGDTTFELQDCRPLLEGLDVGDQVVLVAHPGNLI